MSRADDCKCNLILKAEAPVEGYRKVVERGEMGLQYLDFGLIHLSGGEYSDATGDCEFGLDIHSGVISLEITSPGGKSYERLGGREDVFGDLPTVIYLPPNTTYRIEVEQGPVDIAVYSALAQNFTGDSAVIGPKDITALQRGADNWSWEARPAIGGEFPASKLVMGESIVPSGNWACFPPHKHDAFNPPKELLLEEIYYFKTAPAHGFGLLRAYTAPTDPGRMNDAYVIEDGDTVVIPRGYHTLVAAPSTTLGYTWAMAGGIRGGQFTLDPEQGVSRDS